MEFLVPCQTFYQLATVAALNPADGQHSYMRAVVFHRRSGFSYVWASSPHVLSCYNLGKSEGEDVTIVINYDPILTERCRIDGDADGELKVMVPGGMMAIISSNMGYIHSGDLLNKDTAQVDEMWRRAVPDELPTTHNGALFIDTSLLPLLGASSPSGRFAFPEFIDSTKPVIVRDVVDPDWFGVFHPKQTTASANTIAKLPGWFVK